MASSWGLSWGLSWGNSWGPVDTGGGGSGSSKKRKRKRVKLADIWALQPTPVTEAPVVRKITPKITPAKKVWTYDDLGLAPSPDIDRLQREIALLRAESNDKALAQKQLELLHLEDEEAIGLILMAISIDEQILIG